MRNLSEAIGIDLIPKTDMFSMSSYSGLLDKPLLNYQSSQRVQMISPYSLLAIMVLFLAIGVILGSCLVILLMRWKFANRVVQPQSLVQASAKEKLDPSSNDNAAETDLQPLATSPSGLIKLYKLAGCSESHREDELEPEQTCSLSLLGHNAQHCGDRTIHGAEVAESRLIQSTKQALMKESIDCDDKQSDVLDKKDIGSDFLEDSHTYSLHNNGKDAIMCNLSAVEKGALAYSSKFATERIQLHNKEDDIDEREVSFAARVEETDGQLCKIEQITHRTVYKKETTDSIRNHIAEVIRKSPAWQRKSGRREIKQLCLHSSVKPEIIIEDEDNEETMQTDSETTITLSDSKCSGCIADAEENTHSTQQTSSQDPLLQNTSQTLTQMDTKGSNNSQKERETIDYQQTSGSNEEQADFAHLNGFFDYVFTDKEVIGRGGFGKVYKAVHKLEQKEYAIKRVKLPLKHGEDIRQNKTFREVAVMISLDHPNIVRHHTTWTEMSIKPSKKTNSPQQSELGLQPTCSTAPGYCGNQSKSHLTKMQDHTRISDLGFEWDLGSQPTHSQAVESYRSQDLMQPEFSCTINSRKTVSSNTSPCS